MMVEEESTELEAEDLESLSKSYPRVNELLVITLDR